MTDGLYDLLYIIKTITEVIAMIAFVQLCNYYRKERK